VSAGYYPEVIAALLLRPRTADELVEYTGAHRQTIDRCLHALKASGVVYRSGSIQTNDDGSLRTGVKPVLWAIQGRPFEKDDKVDCAGVPL